MFRFGVALLSAVVVAKNKAGSSDGKTFVGTEYISLSAQAKSDKIWEKVKESDTSGGWHFAGTLIVDQAPVFDTPGDELECYWNGCRNKTIHAQGNVAKIQWVDLGGHDYTGVFNGGADYGYVRFSVAAPVDTKGPNMKPGMGVKLLRDGQDSANFVAMYSVDGQDSLNWFEHDWENHIPDPHDITLKPLEARFATQTNWIQTVGLSDMASYDKAGNAATSVNMPWKLRFEATGEFKFPATKDAGYTDFREDLASIPSGSTLWNIYAMDKPQELGGTEKQIAKMVTASECTTSLFGDDHLYFRHQRMDDDLKLRPEWEQYTPKYGGIFSLEEQYDNEPSGCPFANIIDYLQ